MEALGSKLNQHITEEQLTMYYISFVHCEFYRDLQAETLIINLLLITPGAPSTASAHT